MQIKNVKVTQVGKISAKHGNTTKRRAFIKLTIIGRVSHPNGLDRLCQNAHKVSIDEKVRQWERVKHININIEDSNRTSLR